MTAKSARSRRHLDRALFWPRWNCVKLAAIASPEASEPTASISLRLLSDTDTVRGLPREDILVASHGG